MTIDKLNDDVLAEVFKAAVEPTNIPDRAYRLGVSRTLSHVSSRWRRIALSTPSLWSTFHVFLPLTTTDCDLIDALLVRSGAVLLNIKLMIGPLAHVLLPGSRSKACMSSLYSRCDILQITQTPTALDVDPPIDLADTIIALELPSTLRLSFLRVYSTYIGRKDVPALCSFLQSCQVKHLWLDSMLFFFRPELPVTVASELPNLLTFHASDAFGVDDRVRGALEVLESVEDDYRIATPSLQSLDISIECLSRPVNMSNFRSIRRLRFSAFSPSRRYVAEMICGLPVLEELILDVMVEADDILPDDSYYLNEDIPPEWVPPSLISIDFAYSTAFDDIARFLVSGATDILGAGSLKSIDISHCELSEDLRTSSVSASQQFLIKCPFPVVNCSALHQRLGCCPVHTLENRGEVPDSPLSDSSSGHTKLDQEH